MIKYAISPRITCVSSYYINSLDCNAAFEKECRSIGGLPK